VSPLVLVKTLTMSDYSKWDHIQVSSHGIKVVSQARLSLGRRESGQIPIRLLCCTLSSKAPNEVGVNINWDTFCKGKSSSLETACQKRQPRASIRH